MIIDNTYFVNEFYLPQVKPQLAEDNIGNNEARVDDFVVEYVQDCLLKSFGYSLAKTFLAQLDPVRDNGLIDNVDEKWNFLLNGREYTIDDKTKFWRGIRFKNIPSSNYNRSLLTPYVYFFYEKNRQQTTSNIGNVQEKSKNAMLTDGYVKASNAWNKFVDMVQGKNLLPIGHDVTVFGNRLSDYGYTAVDFYVEAEEVSLYEYIRDANNLEADYYPDFRPKYWERINEYGM